MPEVKRKHATTMFTDIIGYTALMGKDGDRAFEMLSRNRLIHVKYIGKHHGTIIKEIGDGTLASFPLASDAVRCAIDIQTEATNQDIPLRIGIHEGEIVFTGDDIFGDSVNIASRLQEMAGQGCIFISEIVYKDIKNITTIASEFVEERELKGVDEPVRVYNVLCKGGAEKLKTGLPGRKSIIVLPFDNMSPDEGQEYFSDGLTEEIITDLSHINGLLVISRSSAMTFKGTKKKIKDIAREVNVRYVMEGSVRKMGNNLRITAQLIDGINDSHLWAEKYSGTMDDIFDIQEKVSRAIVNALKIELSSVEKSKIDKRKMDNTIVYEQYLLARHKIWLLTKESINHAILLLEKNLENYGRNEYLLVALGNAYLQYVNLGIDPDVKYLDKADNLIDEALELNPDLSKTHCLKGLIHEARGELKKAFRSMKQALELDPDDSEPLMRIAYMYGLVGKPEKGKAYINHAIEVDPLNLFVYAGEWWINIFEGNFESALETSLRMYRLDRDNLLSLWVYGFSLAYINKVKKATRKFDTLIANYPDQFLSLIGKMIRHAINNEKEETCHTITDQLEKTAEVDHLCAWWLAEGYSLIGETDKAINHLNRATRDAFINYPFFSEYDPFLENIRKDNRFSQLMNSVKEKWENFEVN